MVVVVVVVAVVVVVVVVVAVALVVEVRVVKLARFSLAPPEIDSLAPPLSLAPLTLTCAPQDRLTFAPREQGWEHGEHRGGGGRA